MGGGGFCKLAADATELFGQARIDEVDASLFASGASLVEAAEKLGLGSDGERAFLASFPAELLERARSTLSGALAESPRVPVMVFFALARGYEVVTGSAAEPARGSQLIFRGPPH